MIPNLPSISTCAAWAEPTDVPQCTDSDGNLLANITVAGVTAPLDVQLLDTVLQAASDTLYAKTGSQFSGACEDTVRPQARYLDRDHGRPISQQFPWWSGGDWGGWSGGYSGSDYSRWGWCTCNQAETPGGFLIPSVSLGVFPLTGIVQILIDGVVQDPTTYRIDDNRYLVRVINPATAPGGDQGPNPGWPCCQRMDLPATETGTWEVTFTYGTPPPPLGILACAELAWQYYLAATPEFTGSCNLNTRTIQIVRQGITTKLNDPIELAKANLLGLTLCDAFIQAVNPQGLRRRSHVLSPDIKRRVTRTGPVG